MAEESKIKVVKANCPRCGSEVFTKKGNIHDELGKLQKFTREICRGGGCGYIGETIIVATGKPIHKQPDKKE